LIAAVDETKDQSAGVDIVQLKAPGSKTLKRDRLQGFSAGLFQVPSNSLRLADATGQTAHLKLQIASILLNHRLTTTRPAPAQNATHGRYADIVWEMMQ
jgi:hypothetical protein